jgi:DNA-binding SARP family transcriptional activator/class 3 adenylate cyclase/tetratricopeptide (TPR) repeat protein
VSRGLPCYLFRVGPVLELGLLGPLEVRIDHGAPVALGGVRQRALLAVLALHANQIVSTDHMIDELWGEHPPSTAVHTVQVFVSRLRRALGPVGERLLTRPPGYVLELDADELDAARFERLYVSGRSMLSAGDAAGAVEVLMTARSFWRGPPLADFTYEPFAQAAIARLEELRLSCLEELFEAELALGRHQQLVPELEASVRERPLRERARGQLMLALYRCGRQAEALEGFREARQRLIDEVGIEPGVSLRELHEAILRQDAILDLPTPASENAGAERDQSVAPRRELSARSVPSTSGEGDAGLPVKADAPRPARPMRMPRKIVTVLFAEIVDFTGLTRQFDPEALQRLMSRCFDEMRAVLESHGGTAEIYLGNAVMAIFGVPIVHEDDAVRAVRAAAGMRDALPGLNRELEQTWGVRLGIRIGVNTGEVIVGDRAQGRPLAAGAAVNVAKRLQEAAAAGEILIGQPTCRLVGGAVQIEPVEPGSGDRAGAIDAVRLVDVLAGAPGRPRRFDTPLVGRGRRLEALSSVFSDVAADRACHLYTVLGPAGIGKSRLGLEFVEQLGDGVTVLAGRCLPYGDGITYWPLADALRELSSSGGRPGAKLSVDTIAEQVADEPKAQLIAERVAAVLGVGVPVACTPEETFWAIRKLLEALASRRPLIVVFDDVHWAEPTFLDLIEHIADYSRGCPIFILCLARPELLDERPGWSGGKLNATCVLLEPLSYDDCAELIANLRGPVPLAAKSEARIAEAAEGNPLFAEELLAMVLDDTQAGRLGGQRASGDPSRLSLPPTIQALLSARLELLPADERSLVELASVEGTQFHRGAVAELAQNGSEGSLDRILNALVRRDLIRPDRATFAGEQAFRFRHVLIRDAAYESLQKDARAELHERFAAWIERTVGNGIPEFEEIVGYHLELAYQYVQLLRGADADGQALAARASRRLESAGRRALRRSDLPAAIGLLERAAALPVDDDPLRPTLLVDLAATQIEAGKLTRAKSVLVEAVELAAAQHDVRASAHVEVQRQFLQLEEVTGQGTTEAKGVVERVLPVFEIAGDHLGLCRALRLRAYLHWIEGHAAAAARAWEEAAEHARLAGAERERIELLTWVASSLCFGPTPVDEAITVCEQIRAEVSTDVAAEAAMLHPLALLHAMGGRLALARELLATSRALRADIDPTLNLAVSHPRAIVEMMAGDPAAAEMYLKADSDTLDEMKDEALLSTTDALRAQALLAQGRDEEAEHYTQLSEQRAETSDLLTQMMWRSVRARVLARRGNTEEAEPLALEAVGLAEQTDFLSQRADVLLDFAHVLHQAGRLEVAGARGAEALHLYEQKGNSVAAASARALLARLSDDISTRSGASQTVAAGPSHSPSS